MIVLLKIVKDLWYVFLLSITRTVAFSLRIRRIVVSLTKEFQELGCLLF